MVASLLCCAVVGGVIEVCDLEESLRGVKSATEPRRVTKRFTEGEMENPHHLGLTGE